MPASSNTYTEAEASNRRCVNVQLAIASANGTIAGIVSSLGFGVDREGLRALAQDPESDLPSILVRCIASNCMAWQWDDPAMTVGFCGLARRK